MTIFGFRPALWPTLIILPALILTFGLGIWQVQRLSWKENLIAERRARLAMPVLETFPKQYDPEKHQFRRVTFSGKFVHEKEMHRPARSRKSGALGLQIITPFRLHTGGTLLVNRGWVPKVRQSPETRRDGQILDPVVLTGVMRTPAPVGYFVPDNNPEKNTWFRLDLKQMAAHAGLKDAKPFYVDLVADGPGGLPKGSQTRVTARNSHLQYAITWFSMTLIGLIIYVLWHRRYRPAGGQTGGPGPGTPSETEIS